MSDSRTTPRPVAPLRTATGTFVQRVTGKDLTTDNIGDTIVFFTPPPRENRSFRRTQVRGILVAVSQRNIGVARVLLDGEETERIVGHTAQVTVHRSMGKQAMAQVTAPVRPTRFNRRWRPVVATELEAINLTDQNIGLTIRIRLERFDIVGTIAKVRYIPLLEQVAVTIGNREHFIPDDMTIMVGRFSEEHPSPLPDPGSAA